MFAQVKANATVAIIPPREGRTGVPTALAAARLAAGALVCWQGALAAQAPAALARGDSAWRAGRYPEARTEYAAIVAGDSAASSRAVFRLATLQAWDGNLDRAVTLYRLYLRLEPRDDEGRIALARTYAWQGATARAVAVYDSILTRDRTYRDAALGAAQAEAWAGRFAAAIGRYHRWLEANPRDVEAELARARTLAWWGRLAEAERAYAAIAARGERLEAEKGIALVASWRGDLIRSERLWRAIVARAPKDAEAWVGLGQVLRWSGRPEDARDALGRALAADPKNADAAEQLRWVRGDLAPAAEPSASVTWDSDDNRVAVVGGGVSVRPFRRARLTIGGSHRDAELADLTGTADAGRLALRIGLGPLVTVAGEVGVTRTRADDGRSPVDRTRGTGAVAMTLRPASWLSFGGNARRAVFDETAPLLRSGIEVESAGGEIEIGLGGRVTLAGGGEWAELTGGSGPNRRLAGSGSLRWKPRRWLGLALAGRAMSYDSLRRDGYFSPDRYRLGELVARWTPGRDLGWAGILEGAVGVQDVAIDPADPGTTRGTQRVSLGIAYRPGPGSEVGLDYAFSNVSATSVGPAGGGSIYRAQAVSLRGRVTF